jgi:hypothetical protein
MKITRKTIRKWNDDARTQAKKFGYGYKGYEKKQTPAKIALNRISIPKEEPPKWYSDGHYSSRKSDALKSAADYIRKKKCQYAKIVSVRDEDGTWYGVLTYPKVKLY